MKLLLILGLLALVGGVVYWRMRPYLLVARRVFGALRNVRRMSVGIDTPGASRPRATEQKRAGEKLARCAACGVWFPASRGAAATAPPAGSSVYYCSAACLERAGTQPPATRRKSAL